MRTILITDRLQGDDKVAPSPDPHASRKSRQLRKGARGVVTDVRDDAQSLGDEAHSTISRRLLELGFIPGEPIEVVEEIWPGGDPIAVRLGNTTFALSVAKPAP